MRAMSLSTALVVLAAVPVAAEADKLAPLQSDDPHKPRTYRLAVRPAAEPRPALRHQFVHRYVAQKPGNAALLYYRMLDRIDKVDDKDISRWLDAPVAKLPVGEVRELLGKRRSALADLADGARREDCDWQIPIREEGWSTVLPPLARFRDAGLLLALKARLEIATGRYGEAVRTLTDGFAFARHLAETPTLVNALVGIAVADTMLDQARVLMQADNAPNLYWALATLPHPPVEILPAIRVELGGVLLAPEIGDTPVDELTAEQWKRLFYSMLRMMGQEKRPKLYATAVAMKLYPEGKRYLAGRGYTTRQIEAMSVHQVIGRYSFEAWTELGDNMGKWFHVPYPQAHARLAAAERRLEVSRAGSSLAGFPFTHLLPSVGRAYFIGMRLPRRVAALQCIEAVRMHAAANAGTLPASLDEITVVPAPVNPVTGRPFVYRRTDEGFVLTAAAARGMDAKNTDIYEVSMTDRPRKEQTR